MGNNTSHSKNKFKKTKSQASCMACVPNNEMTSSLDPNELNIFKAFGQPKGKISPKSIAYLSKDEINFLKASGGRNISAIRYYLKKGVQVNTFDEDRTSPLHVASRLASIQVVEELINCGAIVDITDADGWTPLHVASFFKRPIICHLLLKKGANPLIPNKDNKTAFDLAKDGKCKEIFENYFKKNIERNTGEKTDRSDRSERENKNDFSQIKSIDHKFSCSIDSMEDHAKLPNLISPKQHKYYLYFKNMRARNNFLDNRENNELNKIGTITSLSFSSAEDENKQKDEKLFDKSSIIFCDDSQICDSEEKGKNLALNFQTNNSKKSSNFKKKENLVTSSMFENPARLKEAIKLKQNIPFKLKNIYNSSLDVKKNLNFQSSNNKNLYQKPPIQKKENHPLALVLKNKISNGLQASDCNVNAELSTTKHEAPPKPFEFEDSKYVAHYYKNPLTCGGKYKVNNFNPKLMSNKNFGSFSPDTSRSILFVDNKVISIHDFLSEYRETDNNSKKIKIERFNPKFIAFSLSRSKYYNKIIDIGVDLFNFQPIAGISYFFFIGYLADKTEDIAFFLHSEENKSFTHKKLPKKNKLKISSFLTDLNIKEILEILNLYTEKFIFRDMSFISALKFFLSNLNVENDPEKIDILLYAFSRKYFKELKLKGQKEPNFLIDAFQNVDAVHMLAFATIMLDIDIHHMKRKDLTNVINEFNANVIGLNDGENFEKEFISSIIETVLSHPIIVLESTIQNNNPDMPNLRFNLIKDSQLFINLKKISSKNGNKLFQLIIIDNFGVLFRNNNEELPYAIFALESSLIKVKNMKFSIEINLKISEKGIIFGKFKENGIINIFLKERIEYELIDSKDSQKILKYAEFVRDNMK